jgi:UDP-N-acetylglucosamine acyltransferase
MVTIHCSNTDAEDTVIGNECFFMANSHVGHNAVIGNQVFLANSAWLQGTSQSETVLLYQATPLSTSSFELVNWL